jgi:AbrB family looped-hinge helix DNA binding protein
MQYQGTQRYYHVADDQQGQLTIPKRIRDYLGLKPGSEIAFENTVDGRITIKAAESGRMRAQ